MSSPPLEPNTKSNVSQDNAEVVYERWKHWSVNWTAVWIGALSAFGVLVIFGLVGVALGAYVGAPDHRVVDMKKLTLETVIFCVSGSFFSFVAGGWVASRVAGTLHAEPGMLYGAVVWLVVVPMLIVSADIGASSYLGTWSGGLAASRYPSASSATPFVHPDPLLPNPTTEEVSTYRSQLAEYNQNIKVWRQETPKAVRNSAIGAVVSLLLGLIGCVIGGWMATGEPMNFTHHYTRVPQYHSP